VEDICCQCTVTIAVSAWTAFSNHEKSHSKQSVSWFVYELDTTQTQIETVTATATFFGLFFTRRHLNHKHSINLLYISDVSAVCSSTSNMNTSREMLFALKTLHACHIHEQPNIFVKYSYINNQQMLFNFYVFFYLQYVHQHVSASNPATFRVMIQKYNYS
jgi:hypothetical protein